MTDITMRQLLKAGVHFGHQTRYWSPAMAPYIFGDRNKIHIINLEKTLPMLKEAMNYLGSVAAQGGKVLFVGTKRQAGKWVRESAVRCDCPYVDHRWLGGMLTNYKTVKNSIARLKELEQRIDSGALAGLSKKEGLSLERERAKLDRTLSGIKNMNGLPDALFVIDVEHEYIAVAEANKLGIPVVGVVDTNCSPNGVEYVIPGNDDSTRAIQLYLESAAEAISEARAAARLASPVPGDDEYVEVDESGSVVAADDAAAPTAAPADQPDEPVAGGEEEKAAAEPAEAASDGEAAVAEPEGAEDKDAPVRKKVTKKKVAKKKVVKKKAAKPKESDAADEADSKEEEKEAKAAKTTTKKKTTKKKVTKKKVAKKKTTKKKTTKKKSA